MIAAFTKAEEIRFIGHLDLMRTIQRALLRSGLPLEFSKGFHPHILLSFAVPLSVGVIGLNEWMDVPFCEEVAPQEVIFRLNAVLPPAIRITQCLPVDEKLPALMSLVAGAVYHITVDKADLPENAEALYRDFASQSEIVTLRKTKSGEKMTNIKKFVLATSIAPNDAGFVIRLKIANEPDGMLKPALWFHAFCEFLGREDAPFLAYRDCILGRDAEGRLLPLEQTVQVAPC